MPKRRSASADGEPSPKRCGFESDEEDREKIRSSRKADSEGWLEEMMELMTSIYETSLKLKQPFQRSRQN